MREFRVISAVLIRKRNYKIALVRKGTFAQARSDFGFDPIYDLRVERHIIVRKIDVSRLRDQRKPKKQKEDSEVHVREIISNGFSLKGGSLPFEIRNHHAVPSGAKADFRYISAGCTPFPFFALRACAATNIETQSLIWNSIAHWQLNARARRGGLQLPASKSVPEFRSQARVPARLRRA